MLPESTSVSSIPGRFVRSTSSAHGFLAAANAGLLFAICLMLVSGTNLASAGPGEVPPWRNSRWHMRLDLTVHSGLHERHDKPIAQFLNFELLLAGIGRGGETVVPESLRMFEVNNLVQVVDDVPDEGQDCYRVTTVNATYYFRKDEPGPK